MIDDHPSFNCPGNPEQKIWRYLDFSKFVDLLNTRSLFFARADQFDDQFEGSLTKKSAAFRDRNMIITSEGQNSLEKNKKAWLDFRTQSRKEFAINCWHMNDNESAAMWKLYLKSGEGIAIQSNYSRLRNSLNDSDLLIFLGIVKYINYDSDYISLDNEFNPYLHKRESFFYENELRAVIWEPAEKNSDKIDLSKGGARIKVDLNQLIENIFVAPNSTSWITELVKDTIKRFDYKINVINSRLDDKPIY